MTFRTLLKRLKRQYVSVRAFAMALNIDPSHLSRAMGAHAQPFDVRGCLRLAKVTGEDPSLVLRAAGKDEIAGLIEELYGAPKGTRLTPEQMLLLEALDGIRDVDTRRSLINIARASAGLTTTGGAHGGGGADGGEGSPGSVPPAGGTPPRVMTGVMQPRRARG